MRVVLVLLLALVPVSDASRNQTRAGYRQWAGGDCKALVNDNDIYCP